MQNLCDSVSCEREHQSTHGRIHTELSAGRQPVIEINVHVAQTHGKQAATLAEILGESLFANIHDDPRWLPFLERIGKSPEQLVAIEFKVTLPL